MLSKYNSVPKVIDLKPDYLSERCNSVNDTTMQTQRKKGSTQRCFFSSSMSDSV